MTRTVTAAARTARRAQAGALARQGMSRRAIAKRLGVSKDTVRRDLGRDLVRQDVRDVDASAQGGASPGAPDTAGGASDELLVAHPDAPPGASGEPQVHGKAPAGAWPVLQVGVTPELMADLATLTRAGYTPSGAVAAALGVLAGLHRNAWSSGGVRDGAPVEVLAARVRPDPCAATRLALGGAA